MSTRISVPATIANLGAGFDVFAVGLEMKNSIVVTPTGDNSISIALAHPSPELDNVDTNLIIRSFRRACELLGTPAGGWHFLCDNAIPMRRGLGSSAAAIVSGIVAATTVYDAGWHDEQILRLAAAIEGHGDNAAAALFGGMTVTVPNGPTISISCGDDVRVVVFVPNIELDTKTARRAVPVTVSIEDAVFNSARTALFVHAMAAHRYDLLNEAMRDRWHQSHRASLVTFLPAMIDAALETGAYGAALAGAGPSVMAFTSVTTEAVERAFMSVAQTLGIEGHTIASRICKSGIRVDHLP